MYSKDRMKNNIIDVMLFFIVRLTVVSMLR